MTPDYQQLWIDSLYYSVNSRMPKAREQVFAEMVRQAVLKEVKDEHRRLENDDEGRHSFEQDWDALKDWLDQQLKEAR